MGVLRTEVNEFVDEVATATRVLAVDATGAAAGTPPAASSILFAKIDTAATADLVPLSATQKIRVLSYVIVAAGAVNVKFTGGTGPAVDLTGAMPLATNGGVAVSSAGVGLFETAINSKLTINLSGAVQVSGHVAYILV